MKAKVYRALRRRAGVYLMAAAMPAIAPAASAQQTAPATPKTPAPAANPAGARFYPFAVRHVRPSSVSDDPEGRQRDRRVELVIGR
ncbi:MAG: hypothetical protein JNM60_04385 [Candidatus Competibacteraceae bacterium]|nr:hypothetical protein [Candidatus Competibacteraceae bacterium]